MAEDLAEDEQDRLIRAMGRVEALPVAPSASGSGVDTRRVHEEPHHSFGADLVGRTWELEL